MLMPPVMPERAAGGNRTGARWFSQVVSTSASWPAAALTALADDYDRRVRTALA
ncbi:hypothetical protein [Elioraea sp.]|uniref:hypothetical protein n=1 Tax=Elioraea sp. TaxID=2185103 RepID=UPI00261F697C|nr:hypothetical protein [Elioraea sp.]